MRDLTLIAVFHALGAPEYIGGRQQRISAKAGYVG
jgi:hypothetical protein